MQNSDKILYLECGTGISGDMTVAALLDLGADQEKLRKVLEGIPGRGFRTEISRVKKAGIDCCDFNVILDEEHDGHDHDMEYLYGHTGEESGLHDHDHDHGHGHHHHTGMKEIREIIGKLEMTDSARALALRIFEILAGAESEAHGVPVEEVHFHEVGALDSIVDIVAAAVCFDPVPAVANIAKAHRLPMRFTARKGELVTPTGAAIAAALMTQDTLPESFVIGKTGLGAGKREYEIPSILRAMVIEPGEQGERAGLQKDTIWKLECDIDDSTGEQLGYALEKLYEEGAREAHFTPIFMKKNRPGWELTVICDKDHLAGLEDVIFSQTTTIGIRKQEMERTVLERKTVDVQTRYGVISVKISGAGEFRRVHPEYEMVSAAASEYGVPFGEVYNEALKMAYRNEDIS